MPSPSNPGSWLTAPRLFWLFTFAVLSHGLLYLYQGFGSVWYHPATGAGIGFLVLSLGLMAAFGGRKNLAQLCGAVCGLISLTAFVPLSPTWTFGRWIISPSEFLALSYGNATLFLLGATALGGLPFIDLWQPRFLSFFAAIATGIGLSQLFGHGTDFSAAYQWANGEPTSLGSAVAATCFGLGLWTLSVSKEKQAIWFSWGWLAPSVSISVGVASLIFWQALLSRENEQIREQSSSRLYEMGERLRDQMAVEVIPLNNLRSVWKKDPKTKGVAWEKSVRESLKQYPNYLAVVLLDTSLNVQSLVTAPNVILDADFSVLPNWKSEWIQDGEGKHFVTRGADFPKAGTTFQSVIPLFQNARLQGYLVGLYRISGLLELILLDESTAGYSVTLYQGKDELTSHYEGSFQGDFSSQATTDLNRFPISLELWPSEKTLAELRTFLPEAVLGVGFILASILAWLVYLAQMASQREAELQTVNRYLSASEEHMRRQADELLEARETAMAASENKSSFLANTSHEIRTPLNAIIGMTELLRDTRLNPTQKDFVKSIQTASQNLLGLINGVLDFSKIEADKFELESDRFELPKLLHEVELLFSKLIDKKGIRFVIEGVDRLPSFVSGDMARLRQVLVNLVSNALKFTSQGKVVLRAKAIPEDKGKVRIAFEVEDTGMGMSLEEQATLFESFTQGEMGRRFGGSGLGLHISRRIVNLMGGDISVKSSPGKGSVFYFDVVMYLLSEGQKTKAVQGKVPPHLRVLVAEDNEMNQKVIGLLLEKMRCKVELVENGAEAVEKATRGSYDLVVLDCQMPVMEGYEAAQRIRAWEAKKGRARLPIIALTAHATKKDKNKCLQSGMDDFLSKPISVEELTATIAKWGTKKTQKRATSSEKSPLGEAALFSLLMLQDDDPGFLKELLRLFRTSTPEALQKMRKMIQKKNGKGLSFEAHKLKSACGSLGASTMQTLCARLENQGNKKDFFKANPTLKQLETEFDRVLESLSQESRFDDETERKAA